MNTSEIEGLEITKYNRLVAFWTLAPNVWLSLAFAWIVVAISFLFSFEIPASSAVLVGSALISEMLFEQLRWRKLPCKLDGSFFLVPDSKTKKPVMQNEFCFAPAGMGKLGALLSLTPVDLIKENKNRNEIT